MSQALRPVLRSPNLPSLPSSRSATTYICQSCRHARLLRRPKRPYTFTQLVTLSDGSAFTMRTTSPKPVYRSSRDTRNAPLWNPSSQELLNVEEDEAGRLAGFRARYGRTYDAGTNPGGGEGPTVQPTEEADKPVSGDKVTKEEKKAQEPSEDDLDAMFAEKDDAHMLEMISNFGKADKGSAAQIARKKI